ncbi:hypothetical protein F5J12DRAFT_787171 [Pisolithus orientalis]|uniref:uncharacterized protein n=1 Tax=Pisolithus orientalis TaxID=936130 RepID=UPI0022249991|nr:uncharacterized protein F5J12DRAFT_787171 [Pisolithus orientalis]KAI5986987.1 hypothetical protein F5J12DRAFT_787171 [Pisolithus orientalis]
MSPHGSSASLQRCILEAQSHMHTKYHPYRKQAAPPPLELRFAARTTDLSLEDVHKQVSQTLAEIEFIEQQRDLLTEVHTAALETWATAEMQLAMLMDIFNQHDLQDAKDDMAFYHAVYADELVTFTIAATQTEQLESFMDERLPSPDKHVKDNPDHDDDTCCIVTSCEEFVPSIVDKFTLLFCFVTTLSVFIGALLAEIHHLIPVWSCLIKMDCNG